MHEHKTGLSARLVMRPSYIDSQKDRGGLNANNYDTASEKAKL